MMHPKINGQWLRNIGPFGPLTVTETWPHGFDSASWQMEPGLRHPALRANAPVVIYDGGFPVGHGRLQEPGADGQMVVEGLWQQARRAPALNTAGSFTTIPDAAIDGAILRGDVTWGRPVSISGTAWATTADGNLTLETLLDGYAAQAGMRWRIGDDGNVTMSADPTVPTWHVPHADAGEGLTPAEDEFVTHLMGRFLTAPDVYDAVTVGSSDAADVFGRRTAQVELGDLGVITAAKATDVITGMFLRAGARMGWAGGLELGPGQIVTPGGVPAPLGLVRAGQMIRLAGIVDESRPYKFPHSVDVVIGSRTYTEGADTVSITPVAAAARNLSDVLTLALEEDAA